MKTESTRPTILSHSLPRQTTPVQVLAKQYGLDRVDSDTDEELWRRILDLTNPMCGRVGAYP